MGQTSATINITNNTNGTAWIELFHKNSFGIQNGRWYAPAGQTVGSLTVPFGTGAQYAADGDYWWVYLSVINGSPGQYISGGSIVSPGWKECQLESNDSGKTLTFSVNTSVFTMTELSGSCSTSMTLVAPYAPITNVFVLMLENHSFDNIFAMSDIPGITGANSTKFNTYNSIQYNVDSNAPTSMPTDPGHEFTDVVEQLCGLGATYPHGGPYPIINNSGFAANYATTTTEGEELPTKAEVDDIMRCFLTPQQLPVICQLATEFAICDHWFSSMPGPTWPNRYFVHGASSAGLDSSPTTVSIDVWEGPSGFTYPNGSIYDAMNKAGMKWRLYNDRKDQFSDDPNDGSKAGAVAQVASIKNISMYNVNSLSNFVSDLAKPYPYKYTFIEPNYGNVVSGTYKGGSSQHPMDDMYGGEALIKDVYEAIRNSLVWDTSLLIITYDEHGGFYDSVAPNAATMPGDNPHNTYNQYGFTFEQYGVRVPAVVVSPLIPKGTVDKTVYDHSSVLATLENLFGLNHLTNRDAAANNLTPLLSLTSVRGDCPSTLNSPNPSMRQPAPAPANEILTATDAEPIPPSGTLRGMLHVVLKTDYELSGGTPAEKAAIEARYKTLKTRGDARAYINEVMDKLDALKAGKGEG